MPKGVEHLAGGGVVRGGIHHVITYLMPKGVEHGWDELGGTEQIGDYISDAERR